jgi:hypothetical protein
MNDKLKSLMEEIEFLAAERREFSARGLSFRIVHRFRMPGTVCVAGEECLAIFLVYRGREYQLLLSPALLLLADYLLRHSRFAQTATQVAAGIHSADFYTEYGMNGRPRRRIRRLPRSAIREYMQRLRQALAAAFDEAGLYIDPNDVLVAEESVSNHVLYRWKNAAVEVIHLDSTVANVQPLFE